MPRVDERLPAEQLCLFEMGGVDVRRLRLTAARWMENGRSVATKKAYAIGWADFEGWCRSAGRATLPALEETVQLYAVHCLEAGRALATVQQRLASIVAAHRQGGQTPPVGYAVRDLMRAARRKNGTAQRQKAAIVPAELRKMSAALLRLKTVRAVRDRALLVFGFATGMRAGELCALEVSDVRFAAKGVVVWIGRSKTDQEGEGREVGIFAGKRAHSCPVRVLKAWLRVRGKEAGPLFAGVDGGDRVQPGRLNVKTVWRIVRRSVQMIGLDPEPYGAHSLRAGCATAAAVAGAGEIAIMQRTGHKSLAVVKRYIRHADVFGVDPLAKAM